MNPETLQQIGARLQGYDPRALPVATAQAFIAALVPVVVQTETLPIRDALGRVLAADLISPIDVPAHANSAMDGFALRGSELLTDQPTRLRVVGTALAGRAFDGTVPPGSAVRITTGAQMPADLDTVVPHEFTAADEPGWVRIPPGVVRSGEHHRRAGEDLARGSPALLAGRLLRPSDLGLIASLGVPQVAVRRRLRVAFFSTGDELRSLGEPLPAGCIYDSNRYTIWAMLQRLGVEPIDLGVVRDRPDELAAAFGHAATVADAVITSGGVSVGEADHTKQVMAELGEVLFWTIAMRPGRPMAIGRIAAAAATNAAAAGGAAASSASRPPAILFGLPGNPVAVMVTFYAFVRDALLRMAGATPLPLPLLRVASRERLRKRPGRTEYQRGVVERDTDGRWWVRSTGAQGSGILSSMSQANGMIVLPHAQGEVAVGDEVEVLPFDGLV